VLTARDALVLNGLLGLPLVLRYCGFGLLLAGIALNLARALRSSGCR
jgi:hypothetical protein